MTYITPTIPAVADPGPLVYAELETAMLATGWTLEDTVVIATRTHKVFKSAAAGNTRGLDWYLDISYPTTGVATGLLITPFEGYDAATDLGFRGPYSVSSTTIDPTTYSRYGATGFALETNWANSGAHVTLDTPLLTTSFGVHASITRDRVIVMATTEASQVSYAGFFIPTAAHIAHAGAALFPLITVRLSTAADRNADSTAGQIEAAITRVPKLTTISNWVQSVVVSTSPLYMAGRVGATTPSQIDNRITVAPYIVGLNGTFFNSSFTTTTAAGQLDGVYCGYSDAVAARGDTVTLDGVTYVLAAPFSSQVTLFAAV